LTQYDVLKLDREIDPCFANFENKIASKPFNELPIENLEHKHEQQVREMIFGKNERKSKYVEAKERDEKYWLEIENADALFKENLMDTDINKIMKSTPPFMYDENSEPMCSCTSDFYDNKLENFLNDGDEFNYDYKKVSPRTIKKETIQSNLYNP
jgi:hypothetical protein